MTIRLVWLHFICHDTLGAVHSMRWYVIYIRYVKPNGKEKIPNGALTDNVESKKDDYIEATSYEEAVSLYLEKNNGGPILHPVIDADPYYLYVEELPEGVDYDWGAIVIVPEKEFYTKTQILQHRRTRDRMQAEKMCQEYDLPQSVPRWLSHDVIVSPDGCWLWTGKIDDNGYGRTGKEHSMHRRVFSRITGEMLSGLVLCHQCNNRMCVNPHHLLPANELINAEDMVLAKRIHDKDEQTDVGFIVPDCMHGSLCSVDRVAVRKAFISGEFSKRKLAGIYQVPYNIISMTLKPGLALTEVAEIRLAYYMGEQNINQLADRYCIEPELVSRLIEYKKAFIRAPRE
jgi:hypothetical protein